MSKENNFVPRWILESTTAPDEVNREVDGIVGGYVAEFMKRGFSQKQIGSLMVRAFTLPLEEAMKRIDCVLSCGEAGEEESAKKLCVFAAANGFLFVLRSPLPEFPTLPLFMFAVVTTILRPTQAPSIQ